MSTRWASPDNRPVPLKEFPAVTWLRWWRLRREARTPGKHRAS